jgi:hypothetical protein
VPPGKRNAEDDRGRTSTEPARPSPGRPSGRPLSSLNRVVPSAPATRYPRFAKVSRGSADSALEWGCTGARSMVRLLITPRRSAVRIRLAPLFLPVNRQVFGEIALLSVERLGTLCQSHTISTHFGPPDRKVRRCPGRCQEAGGSNSRSRMRKSRRDFGSAWGHHFGAEKRAMRRARAKSISRRAG